VRDTGETPGRGALGSVRLLLESLKLAQVGLDNSILLNVLNLLELAYACSTLSWITYTRKVADQLNDVITHVSSKATEVAKTIDVSWVLLKKLQGGVEVLEVLVLHFDDVTTGDGGSSTGNDHWSRSRECQRQESEKN
jgi:hypothetical protein